jgi:hypothetical protein
MVRLPFALALLVLLFAGTAIGAAPSEVSVSKPSLVCPQAKLGNEDLQAQYEKVWKQFFAEVDLATKALDSEIATRFTEAQTAGNLNLALMWDGMKKQFDQLSELRWDSAKEKKTWKQRFGAADFPDDLTALLKRCDQDYKSARERLEEGYKNIESALTKAGKLNEALKVQAELKEVLAGVPVPQPALPTKPEEKAPPVIKKSLPERMAGQWTRHGFPEYFLVTQDGVWKRVSKDAKNTVLDSVVLKMVTPDVAEVHYPSGWRLECRLAGEDVIAVSETRPDKVRTQGFVLERTK